MYPLKQSMHYQYYSVLAARPKYIKSADWPQRWSDIDSAYSSIYLFLLAQLAGVKVLLMLSVWLDISFAHVYKKQKSKTLLPINRCKHKNTLQTIMEGRQTVPWQRSAPGPYKNLISNRPKHSFKGAYLSISEKNIITRVENKGIKIMATRKSLAISYKIEIVNDFYS